LPAPSASCSKTVNECSFGIDGPDASGKTTLADQLAADIGPRAVRASIDGFHNPVHVRRQRGDLSPEGYYDDSFDYPSLIGELLEPFASGGLRVRTARFDQEVELPARVDVEIPAQAVLVFDGVFLLRAELRPVWTLAVYLTVDARETMRRALARDTDRFGSEADVKRRYAERYLPGQALYRREARPESRADVVVDNTHPAAPIVLRWSTPTGD
jgi:uridine kinase